ncbi:glycosyltransferase family 4 protein [Actinomycetospora corticicola]|uniref:Glycosyltransferase involved in cell wall biosynthesis n=1 Tax=Actinomycetospora corticicola TaxID=663602 RepID=A0A7Y9J4G9_9PSEU|nr:glycosyltransferase family 4 protein [Actinomycetospora corticicola]NYD34674.1 glycosyltransferase involved in cell wall biosynthesis [Actinomycetospora corticicola]
MRIALVHSYHHTEVPSGENVVVDAQVQALQDAGHDVVVVAQHNDLRRRRATYPLEAAATVATGFGPDPTEMLRRIAPDVVHVHNLFPNFGTRWLARWQGPLVATLHNFRPICPAGTLLRDGKRCTDCIHTPRAAVTHRCFQGSRLATLPLAVSTRGGATAHPVVARADRLITISQRAADEYLAAGVSRDKLVVVPNAVADLGHTDHDTDHVHAPRWLFVGRLSAEKGVAALLDAWPAHLPLDLIGTGEQQDELQGRHGDRPNIRFLGGMGNDEVRARLGAYTGLVVPSLWAEAGPPLTYVEALAAGVPVVAVEGNGAADDIARHGTGAVVRARDAAELAVALKDVQRDRPALARRARTTYEQHFSTRAWVTRLLETYQETSHG